MFVLGTGETRRKGGAENVREVYDQARRIVALAQEEARALNHNDIGTEHILLALIREGSGMAAQALTALGITEEAARQQVEEVADRAQQRPQRGRIPFTPWAKKALELSLREAIAIGNSSIGTEHILLGLVRSARAPPPRYWPAWVLTRTESGSK